MSRASLTLEVRAFRRAQSAWCTASLKPSQRRLWAEPAREHPGETRAEEIHAAASTAAPRPFSLKSPTLNVVFPPSGWTYQRGARSAWTGGFKRPDPGVFAHAQFSGDELSASSVFLGGFGICNILPSVSIIFVSFFKKKIPAHEFIRENMQFANFHLNNITYGTIFLWSAVLLYIVEH